MSAFELVRILNNVVSQREFIRFIIIINALYYLNVPILKSGL